MYPTHARNQGRHRPLRLIFFSQVTSPLNARPQGKTLGQSEAGVARTSLLLQTPASPRPHVRHRPVGGTDCHLSAPSRRLIGSLGSSAPVSSRRPPPLPLGAPIAAGGTERAGAALPLSAGGPPSLLPSLPSPSPLPSSGPRVFLPHAPSLAVRFAGARLPRPLGSGAGATLLGARGPGEERTTVPRSAGVGEPTALPPAPRRPRGAEATPHPAA